MMGSSPCASCKLLRRRCTKECIFAPYFPSDDPHKFAIVHKVYGASNISKMLQDLPVHQREDAVSSLVYEAKARVRDPVYGCVGTIHHLQSQVSQLQMQLSVAQLQAQGQVQAQAEIGCNQMLQEPTLPTMQGNQDDQSSLLLCDNGNYESFPGCLGFAAASSSSSNILQDLLMEESFWTSFTNP